MKQVRPPNGPHVLIGDPGYPNHTFEASGNLGRLDEPPDEIHFAWNQKEKHYENGEKSIYFFDNGIYVYFDLGATPPVVETGTWT